ncbi:C-X-C motif chemokine 3-like [Hemitrygon akajei]|uniref:C-X-C motif chemokine 3-like n=1 Tax=Hemitrygon akajei TaxID=2704970 RepID=UPI003BFA06BC
MNYKVTFTIFALFALYVPSTEGRVASLTLNPAWIESVQGRQLDSNSGPFALESSADATTPLAGMSVTVVTGELYCKCIKYVSTFIPLRNIKDFDVFPDGPQCPYTEVIATLKTGKQVCLMPETPWVKRIINRALNNN